MSEPKKTVLERFSVSFPVDIKIILSIVLFFSVFTTDAETFSGQVNNEYGLTQPGVYIDLFAPGTDSLLFSDTSDSMGAFFFDSISHRQYQIRLSSDSLPTQWYSYSNNTMYPQTTVWASSGMNLWIIKNPIDNPMASVLKVFLYDSAGLPFKESYVGMSLINDVYDVNRRIVLTDANMAIFSGLPPSKYCLSVDSSSYPLQYYQSPRNSSVPIYNIQLEKNDTVEIQVYLTKNPGGDASIIGICQTADGIPAQNVTVSLFKTEDTISPLYTTKTYSDGRFWFDYIQYKDYYLKLSSLGYKDQWFSKQYSATLYPQETIWASHSTYDTLHILLSSDPFDNTPDSKIIVTLLDSSENRFNGSASVELIKHYTNNSMQLLFDPLLNRYYANNIAEGNYTLRITAVGYKPQFYSPDENTEFSNYIVTIGLNDTLDIQAHLSNDLVDNTNDYYGYFAATVNSEKYKIGDAQIKIYNDTGVVMQFSTDTSGTLPVKPIPVSNYNLSVESASYPFQYWSVDGYKMDKSTRFNFSISKDENRNFSIFLYNETEPNIGNFTISGSVRDSVTNNPVKNCRVLLLNSQLGIYDYCVQDLATLYCTFSDDSGNFGFSRIEPGEYIVLAEADSMNYVAQFYPGTYLPTAARIISVSSASLVSNVNFVLTKGGTLDGYIKDSEGKALGGFTVSLRQSNSSRYYRAVSGADGKYEIRGIPAGTWNVFADNTRYIQISNNSFEYVISNGLVTHIENFIFEPGGYLSGAFSFNQSDRTLLEKNKYGAVNFFSETDTMSRVTVQPSFTTGTALQFAANANNGTFTTNTIKTGKWGAIFTPEPFSRHNAIDETVALTAGLGWSFIGDTANNNGFLDVLPFDTVKNVPFDLRKGYSLFGKVYYNATQFTGNYNINVFTKAIGHYIQISSSEVNGTRRFELPGLIPGEPYYLQIFAEGFPPQFWSPEGNTINPDRPFAFDSTMSVPIKITLLDNLENGDGKYSNPISLWMEKGSDGSSILKWTANKIYGIDTFFVYSSDIDYRSTLLASINSRSDILTYSFQDNRVLQGESKYVVSGKGKEFTVRSNILFSPSARDISPYETWIDVYGKRDQIVIEWGCGDSIKYLETDSVSLYRKIDSENWKLLFRRPAYENLLIDYKWSRSDSNKTFNYRVELKSGTVQSGIEYIRIDNTFLSQLSRTLMVGIYEEYKTIQQAIDNGSDFDIILVRSGTYKEKINFKGKYLSLIGSWEYGKPPVIDASGDTAILVPFNSNFSGKEYSSVNGFKIQNAKVGISAGGNVGIQRCLFANVAQAISAVTDSSKLHNAMMKNPFVENWIDINAYQCTFIAKTSGNIVAATVSGGVAEVQKIDTGYYAEKQKLINPLVSWYANINIEKSILFQYFSRSSQSTVPVRYSGKSACIALRNCNFWETSVNSPATQVRLEDILHTDPQFKDTLNYFLAENSELHNSGTGYASQWSEENSIRPTAIKNLKIRILSLNSIGLKWDPSPATEKVMSYKIYRVPGDTSLFYINEAMQWDLKLPEDSIKAKFPEFTTNKAYFVDTSVIIGTPYIYAVAAIDSSNNEGFIQLSAPPHITEYMVNSFTDTFKMSGQKWYMLSPWGDSAMQAPGNLSIFHWNDKATGNSLLSQYAESSQLLPGNGYWCKSITDTVLKVPKSSLAGLKRVQDSLKCKIVKGATGWNQISSPFPFPIFPSWLTKYAVWEWNPDSLGYSKATSLKPWHAYWIYAEKDTDLILLDKTWPPVYDLTLAKKTSGVNWELNLSMHGESAWDPENKIGSVRNALYKSEMMQSPEPPLAFGSSQLFFLSSSDQNSIDNQNSQRFAHLYKAGSEKTIKWLVGISPSEHKSFIKVQGIADLPKGLFAAWINGKNVQDLTNNNEIMVEPHDDNIYGYILVTSDLKEITIYKRNFNLRAPFPNPFRSSTRIEYFVPYQFSENGMMMSGNGVRINLAIYNIAGQKIKTLVNGDVKTGSHTIVWNGTDESMQKVSAGFYIVRLLSPTFNKSVKLFRVY